MILQHVLNVLNVFLYHPIKHLLIPDDSPNLWLNEGGGGGFLLYPLPTTSAVTAWENIFVMKTSCIYLFG